MSIRVTCPGCHSRFNVSDEFAGRTGPCPKCKKTIKIPDKAEEVVVHAPESFGPKDSKGRAVLKPIFREEAKVSMVQVAAIVLSIVLGLAVALVLRFSIPDPKSFPMPMLILGAILLAPPLSWAGYGFLRNRELEAFKGMELWIRILGASAGFAALWLLFPAMYYALNASEYTLVVSSISLVVMLAAGGGIAMVAFDYDYLMGTVHYGLYLLAILLMRLIAGLDFIPLGGGS